MSPNGNLIYPLNEFYHQAGLPLPLVHSVASQEIPEPYRGLVVHERDMTPTLEAAYRQNVRLQVLRHLLIDSVLARQVVLKTESGARPVLFGAIKIYLEHFPVPARQLVLANGQPLGAILRSQEIQHFSRPDAYIRVEADPVIASALELATPRVLFGRRNLILDAAQHALARVVEILP